jgi:hypothetical protein
VDEIVSHEFNSFSPELKIKAFLKEVCQRRRIAELLTNSVALETPYNRMADKDRCGL